MHVEDLNVGDWIIILSWKPELVPLPTGEMASVQKNASGDPLHILAVDMPFLVVQFYGMPPYRTTIDTRRANVRKTSPEYIKALFPLGVPGITIG